MKRLLEFGVSHAARLPANEAHVNATGSSPLMRSEAGRLARRGLSQAVRLLRRVAICPNTRQTASWRASQPADSGITLTGTDVAVPIAMIEKFWTDTDNAILDCLRALGAMSPVELAEKLGISPGECTTLVCFLATQGKVKIALVEREEEETNALIPVIRRRREAIRPRA
jgi:hypothetical protein